jgi:hypothetical protein
MQTLRTRDYWLAICVFIGAWASLSAPWLSGTVTIPYDAKALFQAQLQFLANAFHSGQSPWWNPSTFGGMPQIADPQSLIFSPAVLLAYFEKVPSFRELDAYVFLLLALGGLAIFMFCRDRGWHPAGCAIAAMVFAFGASSAWRVQHIVHIQSLAYFAIALWLLARALNRSSVLYGFVAGIAAGMMLIEPNQVALLGGYVLAGLSVGHWLESENRKTALIASLTPLACAALAAIAIDAIPLLSTYLFLEASNRPEVLFTEAVRGSLHPASLLTAVVPDLFGSVSPTIDYWGPYSEWWDKNELTVSMNMSQMYIGVLPMLLVLTVGVVRGALWAREVRVLSIATLFLVVYALGGYTPIFQLFFNYLPGVAFFRRPVDATFLIGATLAILTGYLVHLWASGKLPVASSHARVAEAAVLAVTLVVGLGIAWGYGKTADALKPLAMGILWIAAAAVLLAAPMAWVKRSVPLAIIAPALFLTSDLALSNGPNGSTAAPPAAYEVLKPDCKNATVRFLKEHLRRNAGSPWRDRVEVVGLGFDWQNVAQVHGFESTLGYNPFRLAELSLATGARDYIAGPDQKTFSPLFATYGSPMADHLGIRFVVTGARIEEIDRKLRPGALKLVARTADAFIYENPDALPRVLFVTDWQRADFNQLSKTGIWPPFDPRRTVLLDKAPARQQSLVALAKLSGISSAHLRSYENTRVVVNVDAAQAGFLVLHDLWHPWWKAEIDGREAPILRANILFRAVEIPAGRHVVTFQFEPLAGAVAEVSDMLFEPAEKAQRAAAGPIAIPHP